MSVKLFLPLRKMTSEQVKRIPLKNHPNYFIESSYPYNIYNKNGGRVFDGFTACKEITVFVDGRQLKKHRLIADQFIPNPLLQSQVRFRDGNKHNYHIENLYWAGHSEQVRKENALGITRLKKEIERLGKCFHNDYITQEEYNEKHNEYVNELNRLMGLMSSSSSSSDSE